jgi:hypothetical protein
VAPDADVIRDMGKIPGVLHLPDTIVEGIYNHMSHTRFTQQNAQIQQDIMKLIKQPYVKQQDAEKFIREKIAQVSGTVEWKRGFISRLAQAAKMFRRTAMQNLLESLIPPMPPQQNSASPAGG